MSSLLSLFRGSRPIHLTASQTFSASPESGSGMSSADESDDGARSASPPSSSETDLSDQLSDSSGETPWSFQTHFDNIPAQIRRAGLNSSIIITSSIGTDSQPKT